MLTRRVLKRRIYFNAPSRDVFENGDAIDGLFVIRAGFVRVKAWVLVDEQLLPVFHRYVVNVRDALDAYLSKFFGSGVPKNVCQIVPALLERELVEGN